MKNNCSFCDLDSQADRVIHSNDLVVSFLSNPRLTPGHVLVIPRRHLEPPQTLDIAESIAIFAEIERLSKLILTKFDGIDLWQKTRPLVPETEIKRHHLHFHLLPSRKGTALYSKNLNWSVNKFSRLTKSERDEMLQLYRPV